MATEDCPITFLSSSRLLIKTSWWSIMQALEMLLYSSHFASSLAVSQWAFFALDRLKSVWSFTDLGHPTNPSQKKSTQIYPFTEREVHSTCNIMVIVYCKHLKERRTLWTAQVQYSHTFLPASELQFLDRHSAQHTLASRERPQGFSIVIWSISITVFYLVNIGFVSYSMCAGSFSRTINQLLTTARHHSGRVSTHCLIVLQDSDFKIFSFLLAISITLKLHRSTRIFIRIFHRM